MYYFDCNSKQISVGCVVKDKYGDYWWVEQFDDDQENNILCRNGLLCAYFTGTDLEIIQEKIMSHFSVAVVLPEYTEEALAKALQPYHEFECTGIKDQYVVKIPCEDHTLEEYNNEEIPCIIDDTNGKFLFTRYSEEAEKYWVRKTKGGYSSDDELILPSNMSESALPATEVYSTYREYLEDWCGIELDSKYYSFDGNQLFEYTNPNAKWDWWQTGGRYCGHFGMNNPFFSDTLIAQLNGYTSGDTSWCNAGKNITGFDIIRKKDIDLESNFEEVFQDDLKDFELYLETVENTRSAIYRSWEEFDKSDIATAREEYWCQPVLIALAEAFKDNPKFKWDKPTPETFFFGDYNKFKQAKRYQMFGTYAMIKDNHWYAKGDMGWWGCDSNVDTTWDQKWFELFDSIPDSHWVVVVDCHI